jgi:hypothetical protein
MHYLPHQYACGPTVQPLARQRTLQITRYFTTQMLHFNLEQTYLFRFTKTHSLLCLLQYF